MTSPPRHHFLVFLALLLSLTTGCDEKKEVTKPAVTQEKQRGPVILRLLLDRDSLTLAESLQLTIEVELPETFAVELPAYPRGEKHLKEAEEIPVPVRLSAEGRTLHTRRFRLDPFLAASTSLPALTLKFKPKAEADWVEVTTDPIPVTITSTLSPEEKEPTLRPLAGALEEPRSPLLLAGLAILLLLFVAGGILFVRRHRRSKSAILPPPRPAHEIAEERLTLLLADNLINRGEISLFYRRLSDIVRQYIEARFLLRAPEQTTEEFFRIARQSSALSFDHQTTLREFLRLSDLVKFARYLPPREDIDRSLLSCRRFIQETIPQAETEEKREEPHGI